MFDEETKVREELERCLASWQASGDRDALDRLLQVEIKRLKRRVISNAFTRRLPLSERSASGIAVDAAADAIDAGTNPRFPNMAAFRGYLWKTARNLQAGYLRRRATRRETLFSDTSGFERAAVSESRVFASVEREDEAAKLRFVMGFLDPAARDLITRVRLREERIDDVAASLGVTRETVEMRLVRARRLLGEKLATWKRLVD